MDLQHFSHEHPLEFFPEKLFASKEEGRAWCCGCGEDVQGPSYSCIGCKFYLHQKCAELELPLQINNPFHPSHPLFRLTKAPDLLDCEFCRQMCLGFVYYCSSCEFYLDFNCALFLHISITGPELKHPFHHHLLIFLEKYSPEIHGVCSACQKTLSGPIYRCLNCSWFILHKDCTQLPREINHPKHRRHNLFLLAKRPRHPKGCSCHLCDRKRKGFVYYCSLCEFGLALDDALPLRKITSTIHEHPFKLLCREISFVCDFCGDDGDYLPYLCSKCDLMVHKDCVLWALPLKIRITHHPHPISHRYFISQSQYEEWECRICHFDVDIEHGSYSCSLFNCNYIAHVNCATNKSIWDGKAALDESSNLEESESENLIEFVIKEESIGDDVVATEIKHAYHEHSLVLVFSSDQTKDNGCCDGCVRQISTPFYSCGQCKFLLHKSCAELPKVKRHLIHKHKLTLGKEEIARCSACGRLHSGFVYKCEVGKSYEYFSIDIACSSLMDTFRHPSHDHQLFLDHNLYFDKSCSACPSLYLDRPYTCVERCEFFLDFACLTLPLTADYKYDDHPLTLTYEEDCSYPARLYCDICEEERDSNHWFYNCLACDTSVHTSCVLGELPFIKLGTIMTYKSHPHPLTFVRKIWNCPPCSVCDKLCQSQAFECKEPECNFIAHYGCAYTN